MNRISWRRNVLAVLGALNIAALPAWIVLLYEPYISSRHRFLTIVLHWPQDSLFCCMRQFDLSSGEREPVVYCFVVTLLVKMVLLLLLLDWIARRQPSHFLAEKDHAAWLASLCSFLMTAYWEVQFATHFYPWVGPQYLAVVILALGVANVFALIMISKLHAAPVLRIAFSLPFWFLWAVWVYTRHVHRELIAIPLLGLVLYAASLRDDRQTNPRLESEAS
jgi:hypothetical protein